MLLIRTGRRMNEVLMMDFDPLLPLITVGQQDGKEADGFVARLRYQQTKITSGDPPTIPVDQEIVDIIRLQQQWAREFIVSHGAPEGATPRYLFLQTRNNRLGLRPYASATFHVRLGVLTRKLAITDSVGRPVRVSKTHTFRHTRATDLINAGVPVHVVMRYLGHLTPAMTMHYAKTLAITAEREFLRYKKVTADGRTAALDPSDLYDLLHLDQRADRVLPNGWCMLPPKQVCSKGNACLTCDKFVTDASHRDELARQLAQTEELVARRQAQFTARYGQPMEEDNVWLAGRLSETQALRKVLITLDQIGVRDGGKLRAVRGAGAADRAQLPASPSKEPTT
ncbi:tyrosine-type recombinase/integrase [Sphaerisporangium sp. NPDC049002]